MATCCSLFDRCWYWGLPPTTRDGIVIVVRRVPDECWLCVRCSMAYRCKHRLFVSLRSVRGRNDERFVSGISWYRALGPKKEWFGGDR